MCVETLVTCVRIILNYKPSPVYNQVVITLLRPPLRATLSPSRVMEAAVMMHPLPPPALVRRHTAARLHTEPSLLTPDTGSRLLLLQLLPGTGAIFNP